MLLEDSDEEVAPISKRIVLVDSDDDDDDSNMEINTVSMEKKRTLGDSDEEDDPCPVRKKNQLIYSDEEVSDAEKNKSVKITRKLESSEDDFSPIKKRVSSVNIDDGNGLEKNKKMWLEDSSDDEIEVALSKKEVSPVNSDKDESDINSSSSSDKKTLDHRDDEYSPIPVQKLTPLSDTINKNRTENSIDLKEKEKNVLEDSDKEDCALLMNKVSSSINENESDTEECNVSINKRKQFEDSNEEDIDIPIMKKVLLSSSINNKNGDMEEGTILVKKKTKILEDDEGDEEDNVLKTKEVLSSNVSKNKSDTEISTISNKTTFLKDSNEEDDTFMLNTNVSLNKSEKRDNDVDKSIVLMNNKIILENSYGDEIKEKLLLAHNTDNGASCMKKNDLSPKNTNTFFEDGNKESSHDSIDTESQMNNSDSRGMEGNKNNQLFQNSGSETQEKENGDL